MFVPAAVAAKANREEEKAIRIMMDNINHKLYCRRERRMIDVILE